MVYTAVWWRIPGEVLTEVNFMVRHVVSKFNSGIFYIALSVKPTNDF